MNRPLDIVRELQKSPYFKGIPETVLHPLSVHADLVRMSDGQVFAPMGGRAEELFLILRGEVEVVRVPSGGGAAQVVSVLKPGMLVGHVALLRDQPRTASYRAKGPVHLLEFSKKAFDILRSDETHVGSAMRRALIMALSNHLYAANRKLSQFLAGEVPQATGAGESAQVLADLHITLSGQGGEAEPAEPPPDETPS